ncbi:MAG: hypothetical protein SCH71_11770 [Desulfobulbaceae bacterium]|nr:hypothetical protein [Desulfobulbaceae bacterium]
MKRVPGRHDGSGYFHAAVIFISAAVIAVFMAGCTGSPEQTALPAGQSVPAEKNKELCGTWVSEQHPEQKHIFTEEEAIYQELEYSVVLQQSGPYKLRPDGTVEWIITWYSGNYTQWRGKLEGDRISVEFKNSWDESQGRDTLTRVQF